MKTSRLNRCGRVRSQLTFDILVVQPNRHILIGNSTGMGDPVSRTFPTHQDSIVPTCKPHKESFQRQFSAHSRRTAFRRCNTPVSTWTALCVSKVVRIVARSNNQISRTAVFTRL